MKLPGKELYRSIKGEMHNSVCRASNVIVASEVWSPVYHSVKEPVKKLVQHKVANDIVTSIIGKLRR